MPGLNASPAPQLFRREATGASSAIPLGANASTFLPNLFPRSWQCGGVFQQIVSVVVPALAANATTVVSQKIPLAPQLGQNQTQSNQPLFPMSVNLGAGQQAVIIAGASPTVISATTPAANPFLSAPYVMVSFAQGLPGSSPLYPTVTSSTFSLTGPINVSQPYLTLTMPVLAPGAAYGGGSVPVNVWALIFAVPL